MATVTGEKIAEVLERVKTWSQADRMDLALRILGGMEIGQPRRVYRGKPVEDLIGMGAGRSPAPDDQTVGEWIHEHRSEKYG